MLFKYGLDSDDSIDANVLVQTSSITMAGKKYWQNLTNMPMIAL